MCYDSIRFDLRGCWRTSPAQRHVCPSSSSSSSSSSIARFVGQKKGVNMRGKMRIYFSYLCTAVHTSVGQQLSKYANFDLPSCVLLDMTYIQLTLGNSRKTLTFNRLSPACHVHKYKMRL